MKAEKNTSIYTYRQTIYINIHVGDIGQYACEYMYITGDAAVDLKADVVTRVVDHLARNLGLLVRMYCVSVYAIM